MKTILVLLFAAMSIPATADTYGGVAEYRGFLHGYVIVDNKFDWILPEGANDEPDEKCVQVTKATVDKFGYLQGGQVRILGSADSAQCKGINPNENSRDHEQDDCEPDARQFAQNFVKESGDVTVHGLKLGRMTEAKIEETLKTFTFDVWGPLGSYQAQIKVSNGCNLQSAGWAPDAGPF